MKMDFGNLWNIGVKAVQINNLILMDTLYIFRVIGFIFFFFFCHFHISAHVCCGLLQAVYVEITNRTLYFILEPAVEVGVGRAPKKKHHKQ